MEWQCFVEELKDSDSFSRTMKDEAEFGNYVSHGCELDLSG